MEQTLRFGEVLEAIDRLPPDEQEALLDIVRRRLAERGRKVLAEEIQKARQEFKEGQCRPVTADELMEEVLS
jgi:TRAP-type C4-dicarboxylate transport system substrate-binding protein